MIGQVSIASIDFVIRYLSVYLARLDRVSATRRIESGWSWFTMNRSLAILVANDRRTAESITEGMLGSRISSLTYVIRDITT